MIETFTALAEPSRLRIVELLKGGPRCVNEIGARLQLSQPQVSKHLRVLKTALLVDVEPRANQRLYGLRGDRLRDLNKWLDSYRAIWEERMEQLDDLVQEMSQAPFDLRVAQGPPFDSPAPGRVAQDKSIKKEVRNARRRKK